MPYFEFLWADRIREHLAANDLAPEDFEEIVCNPERKGRSRSSGRPAVWGYTSDGRYVIAVYEMLDELTVLPVTAFEVDEAE